MVLSTKRAVEFSITLVALICAILLAFLKFGPRIEGAIYPVYIDLKYSVVKVESGYMDIVITGLKNRECLFNSYSASIARNDYTISGTAQFINQDGSQLDEEGQRIGKGTRFVRLIRVSPISTNIDINITSRCHPLWLTPQKMVSLQVGNQR